MKTVCIYHSIDLDGWMSAAIVKHWFEKSLVITNPNIDSIIDEIDFIGYNYGQPIPDLSEYDKVIMCDISFPKEEMFKLYENNDLIWLDHHISAINESKHSAVILSYDNSKGIRDTKFAACELTWKYFFPDKPMPEIVRLLGRYDCFGHKFTKEDENKRLTLLEYTKSTTRIMSQEEQDELANLSIKLLEEQKVLEFQYGARAYIKNYEDAYEYLLKTIGTDLNSKMTLEFIHTAGKSIYKFLCADAKQTYKNGFEVFFNIEVPIIDLEELFVSSKETKDIQYSFICINKERFNPINFGIDYHKEGYDGCACFHRTKDGKWAFSLYNDSGDVDCSVIAKQFGGGGHKGAAGMILNTSNFLKLING